MIDGQDQAAISRPATTRAQQSSKPSLIACKTTIGYGRPNQGRHAKGPCEGSGSRRTEGSPRKKLGISLEPFSVPDDVLKRWRDAGARGR